MDRRRKGESVALALSDVARSAGGDVGDAHTHAEAAYRERMPKLTSAQDGVGMT